MNESREGVLELGGEFGGRRCGTQRSCCQSVNIYLLLCWESINSLLFNSPAVFTNAKHDIETQYTA